MELYYLVWIGLYPSVHTPCIRNTHPSKLSLVCKQNVKQNLWPKFELFTK
jgi:hypothetical protein